MHFVAKIKKKKNSISFGTLTSPTPSFFATHILPTTSSHVFVCSEHIKNFNSLIALGPTTTHSRVLLCTLSHYKILFPFPSHSQSSHNSKCFNFVEPSSSSLFSFHPWINFLFFFFLSHLSSLPLSCSLLKLQLQLSLTSA